MGELTGSWSVTNDPSLDIRVSLPISVGDKATQLTQLISTLSEVRLASIERGRMGTPRGGHTVSESHLILVVEDEWYLKADLEQALNDAGFATETASSGEEALELFLRDTKRYNALITDVRLQGALYGWDVARQFREKEPALPVIYVTGSNFEEWASQAVPDSVLISKPFGRVQLIRAIANLLNIGPSPGDAPSRK